MIQKNILKNPRGNIQYVVLTELLSAFSAGAIGKAQSAGNRIRSMRILTRAATRRVK